MPRCSVETDAHRWPKSADCPLIDPELERMLDELGVKYRIISVA